MFNVRPSVSPFAFASCCWSSWTKSQLKFNINSCKLELIFWIKYINSNRQRDRYLVYFRYLEKSFWTKQNKNSWLQQQLIRCKLLSTDYVGEPLSARNHRQLRPSPTRTQFDANWTSSKTHHHQVDSFFISIIYICIIMYYAFYETTLYGNGC